MILELFPGELTALDDLIGYIMKEHQATEAAVCAALIKILEGGLSNDTHA